jgi:signal transduction histidine kinase
MQKIGFYQHLIDLINEPCFVVFDVEGREYTANRQLAKFLNYASIEELYTNVPEFWQLIRPSDKENIIPYLRRTGGSITRVFSNIRFNRIKRNPYKIMFQFNSALSVLAIACVGIVKKTSKLKVTSIDQSLLHFFNEDKFLDEAIVLMDFSGNIISANRRLMVIDFFADLADKKFNLIERIDSAYKEILTKRLNELKKGHILPPQEYKLVSGDNKSAYIEMYSKSVIHKGKKVIVGLIRDITLRKELEKKLLFSIVQTEEKERQRFAQDLHDDLGPFISGLKLYINELRSDSGTENKKMLFDYMHAMIDEAVGKVRNIISNITPQNMIDEGLTVSVLKMIEKLGQTEKFLIDFSTRGKESNNEPSLIITLYRIILELINNSIKHSGSKNIKIRLIYRKKFVNLLYTDDGKGFDLDKELQSNKGIGLKSIINRIELYQGSYKFTRHHPAGIEFNMTFPTK